MMASQTTLDEKFLELLNAKHTHQKPHPKIQKVRQNLRNKNNHDKYYSPMAVSIGPIHHDNKNLKIGDTYKLTLAAKYIRYTKHTAQFLHKKIADNISELKGLFAEDVLTLANNTESLKGFSSLEEKLSWLLFVDGCFLLYFLINMDIEVAQLDDTDVNIEVAQLDDTDVNIEVAQLDDTDVNIEVAQLDDTDVNIEVAQLDDTDVNIEVDRLEVLVMSDVLLLENQLPYLVLKLLWKNDNENELIQTMVDFLEYHLWSTPYIERRPGILEILLTTIFQKAKKEPVVDLPNQPQPVPIHLLDLQRVILTKSNQKKKKQSWDYPTLEKLMAYRNIEDLTAVGIKLKSSGTRSPLDVDFSEGWFDAKLTLPEITMHETTIISILNLVAYEMCLDFENDYGICSFVRFMDSLIDTSEDVKKLRSEGILANLLGRNEEVADLFNIISTDLANNPFIYAEVKDKIHKHYLKKSKIWLALGYRTYFSNPWAIIGFLAGVIALVLTFLQTWFSIKPR